MRRLAFASYVRPAEARPELWRLVLGIVLSAAVYAAVVVAVLGAAFALLWPGTPVRIWAGGLLRTDQPGGTLLLLATFAGMALGPMAAARLLHRRPACTLFGPPARCLRDFAAAAAIVLGLFGLTLGLWAVRFDPLPQLDPALWAAVLPLTLIGLAVQTGAEEILFRGYLTQQLAARFRSPLVWMALPALAFGLVHYDPALAGGPAWAVVAGAAVFGLIAADLTAVTGSLGAAWGFHFANNVVALSLVATSDTITGLALYVTPYALDEVGPLLFLGDGLVVLLAWAACRQALAR